MKKKGWLIGLCLVLLVSVLGLAACKKKPGNTNTLPNTQIINGGFENGAGDLTGWTTDGFAFSDSGIVDGDTIGNVNVEKTGNYFFSGYDAGNPQFTGTMTSDKFVLTGTGKIAFKMGAAKDPDKIYVEFFEDGNDTPIARAVSDFQQPGLTVQMVRQVVDLSAYLNKTVYIKVTDNDKGDAESYAYVNLDDFKVLATEEEVAVCESERTEQLNRLAPPFTEDETKTTIVNGDFEEADEAGSHLKGWLVLEGTAFGKDRVTNESLFWGTRDFRKQGDWFLRGFQPAFTGENVEALTGAIRSTKFTLAGDGYISFLLGGAKQSNTYVAVCRASDDKELIKVTNKAFDDPKMAENMNRVFLDASEYAGQVLYLKVVDKVSAGGFGAINVDDFRVSLTTAEMKALVAETKEAAAALPAEDADAAYTVNWYASLSYPLAGDAPVITAMPADVVLAPKTEYDVTRHLAGVVATDDYTASSKLTKVIAKMTYKPDASAAETELTGGGGYTNCDLSDKGIYTVTVRVSDAYGQTAEETFTIVVSGAPEIDMQAAPYYLNAGTSSWNIAEQLAGYLDSGKIVVTDDTTLEPAVAVVSVQYNDNEPVTSADFTAYSFLQEGTYVITFSATDDENNVTTSTFTNIVVGKDVVNGSFEEGFTGWTSVSGNAQENVSSDENFFGDNKAWWDADENTWQLFHKVGQKFYFTTDAGTSVARSSVFTVGGDGIISFKFGGARQASVVVRLCDANTGEELLVANNVKLFNDPNMALSMQRRFLYATQYLGRPVYVELSDKSTEGFSRLVFDDLTVSLTLAEAQAILDADKAWAATYGDGVTAYAGSEDSLAALINAQKRYYAGLELIDPAAPVIVTPIADASIRPSASVDLTAYLAGLVGSDNETPAEELIKAIVSVTYNGVTDTTGDFAAYDMSAPGIYTVRYSLTDADGLSVSAAFHVTSISNQIVNGGFETGDLTGWTVSDPDLINADAAVSRATTWWGEEIPYNQAGACHFNGEAAAGDESKTYSLRSTNFLLGGSGFISFRMGGNAAKAEVYAADGTLLARYDNTAFHNDKFPNLDEGCRLNTMTTFLADLHEYIGEELYIVLVDAPASPFGHAFFDEIVTYYETAPVLAEKYDAVKFHKKVGDVLETTLTDYNIPWVAAVNTVTAGE